MKEGPPVLAMQVIGARKKFLNGKVVLDQGEELSLAACKCVQSLCCLMLRVLTAGKVDRIIVNNLGCRSH